VGLFDRASRAGRHVAHVGVRPAPRRRPPPARPTGVFAQPVRAQTRQNTFRAQQQHAARKVERNVARQPGRARPPVFPKLKHYTPAQERSISGRTQAYLQRAARERPSTPRPDVTGQIARSGEPQARRALRTAARANVDLAARRDAHAFRVQMLETHRQQLLAPVNAALARDGARRARMKVEGRFIPPNPRDQALIAGPVSHQIKADLHDFHAKLSAGNVHAQAAAYRASKAPAFNAGAVRVHNSQGPLKAGLGFALGPQHNAFAAVSSGLYKHSAAFRDLADLPTNAVSSTVQLAGAGAQAIGGNTKPLGQIWQGLKKHDPVVLAAQGKFGKALFEARTHPFSTALEVSGLGHGAGRALEVAQRAGGPLARGVEFSVPGTGMGGVRPFSKHAAVRVVQRSRLPGQVARADAGYRRAAGQQFDDPAAARDTRAAAEAKDPRVAAGKEVRRRIDERVDANEQVRRADRGRVSAEVGAVMHPDHPEVQQLVAQRIVKPNRADVQAYVNELGHEYRHGNLNDHEAVTNHELRKALGKTLRDPNVDWKGVAQSANALRDVLAPKEKALIDAGLLDKAQAERASLMPYAVRNMGARYDHEGDLRASSALSGDPQALAAQAAKLRDEANHPSTGQFQKGHKLHEALQLEQRAAALSSPEGRAQLLADARKPGLVVKQPDGTFKAVSNDEIRAHMTRNGVEEPAFLPQRPPSNSRAWAFRSSFTREAHRLAGGSRTGEATRKGSFSVAPEVAVQHAVNLQGLLSAERGFREFVKEVAMRRSSRVGSRGGQGEPLTFSRFEDAANAARRQGAATGQAWRPVRIAPFQGTKEQLHGLVEHATSDSPAVTGHVSTQIASALEGTPGPGPWALVPDEAAKRLSEHMNMLGPSSKVRGLQVVNQAFRRTVLPFSTKWLTGNVVEAGLRSALVHAGSGSLLRGRALLKAFDRGMDSLAQRGDITAEEAASRKAEFRARTVGGGHYEMQARTAIHRSPDEIFQSEPFRKVAHAVMAMYQQKVIGAPARFVKAFTDWSFHANGVVERQFQTALLGKGVKDLIDPKAGDTWAKAVQQAEAGKLGTDAQVQLGRYIDKAYGKYAKFSPAERYMIGTFTPFLAWTINSIHFVAHTLPAHHPVVTALMAANENAQQEWLRSHGLDQGLVGQGGNPPFLQGASPVGPKHGVLGAVFGTGGGWVRASRYTPFGLFQDPTGAIPQLVLPQYSGVLNALNGKDWKGDPLNKNHSDMPAWQKVGAALQTFAASTVPIYAQAAQTLSHKGPALVKVQRQFNPLYAVQNTATIASRSGSSAPTPKGPAGALTLPDKHVDPSGGGGATLTLPDKVR
jgi:hypothetical protein